MQNNFDILLHFDNACIKELHKEATDNKIKRCDLRRKKWTSSQIIIGY